MAEGSLISPEGILMLFAAGILDLAGLLLLPLVWFGIDDYGILDVLGLFAIGGWMFARHGSFTATKGAKKIAKRLGLATLIELIPVVGGVAPCWILAVYFELKSK